MEIPLYLEIEGMHCGACVARVTNALQGVAGVEVRNVELGSAIVTFDDARASGAQVVEAVNAIGFQARELPAG
jgi:copper chaperone CopZ